MKTYKVYAKPLRNNPGNDPVYVQSIQAKNKKAAYFSVANMIENREVYAADSYFAIKEPTQ